MKILNIEEGYSPLLNRIKAVSRFPEARDTIGIDRSDR